MAFFKIKKISAIILSVIFIICGCGNASNKEAGSDDADRKDLTTKVTYGELQEGDEAPDFDAELVDGGTLTLSEQSGKVVLLNLWASWCPPCVGEMPAFEMLDKDYGEEVQILCVNCLEQKDVVDAFVIKNGYTFPIAYDEQGLINAKYPTDGIPYTLVIGKDGTVKNIYLGARGAEEQYKEYKAAIDAALEE